VTGSDNKTPITVYGMAVWVVKVPSRTAAYILPVAIHLCRCETLIINLVSRMPGTYNTVHFRLSKRSELCSHERLQDLPEGLVNSTCIIRLSHTTHLACWNDVRVSLGKCFFCDNLLLSVSCHKTLYTPDTCTIASHDLLSSSTSLLKTFFP